MVIKVDTFLDNIDTNYLDYCFDETDKNVKYFEDITQKVINSYSESMDIIMNNIYTDIIRQDNPSIEVLEKYFLELSHCIYYMGEKLERLGIYNSMSKSAYKEVYNKAYLGNQQKDAEKKNKTTVAENQAVAENASIYEGAVNDIYDRAYKILKNKIDAAQTMVSTLSKSISRKMAENQFSNVNNNSRQILNEEFNKDWKPF